ncbi:MAG TPA: site-specific integrase [Gaiellaceae bacterium]|nr:site-specific integrase [Gaiellaceae bacterium]
MTGGRESVPQWAGAFPTRREAEARREWVRGELAAMRVPRLELIAPTRPVTVAEIAERWRKSRVDVADGTAATHRVNLGRILPRLGENPVDTLTAGDVAGLVGELVEQGLARESIRKTRATLAMVLDFAGVQPNPARDRSVKLPREDRAEVNPPTATHILAVLGLMATAYRLPTIVLDATGMRVGELEALTWGDVDEIEGRWRVSAASAKTRRARWVPVPAAVFEAVAALKPREDRDIAGQVFARFGADRYRTTLTRACKAAGVPAFSPHDLRHRRATLWHLTRVPAAQAAAWLGHSPTEHLKTYAHVTLVDRSEIDHARLLHHSVHTPATNVAA